jgi:hypothetical protein
MLVTVVASAKLVGLIPCLWEQEWEEDAKSNHFGIHPVAYSGLR